jgi:high-affinity Fe2+/Pb2+ permease
MTAQSDGMTTRKATAIVIAGAGGGAIVAVAATLAVAWLARALPAAQEATRVK